MFNAVTQVRRGLGEGGVGRMLSVSIACRYKIVPTQGDELLNILLLA